MDYVGILIEQERGKFLFQLRDSNLKIKNKNCWSLFGGGIEKNEIPLNAAIRELKEELGITIKHEQLYPFLTIPFLKKKNYLFRMQLGENTKELQLHEGASMGLFSIRDMILKKNVVPSLRPFLLLCLFLVPFKKSIA